MNKNRKPLLLFGALLVVLITGCSSDAAPLPQEEIPQQDVLALDRSSTSEEVIPPTIMPEALPAEIVAQENENNLTNSGSNTTPTENTAEQPAEPEQPPQAAAEPQMMDPADLPPVQPEIGFSAPDFSLSTLNGETISLSELRGKNVVINYWVTWCVPCMAELTALENLHRLYQGQDFVLLTVNGIEQDNLSDVNQTVQELGLTYPVLLDEGENFWKSYQVLFLPTSFFIDENGIIRHVLFGGDSEADFKSKIEQLLTNQL